MFLLYYLFSLSSFISKFHLMFALQQLGNGILCCLDHDVDDD